ncbi:MAG: 30S ribosomal protein S5 [Lachnospiraceae bacterium]|nr:30S ribosomal protein S5 [Lachnospiraceae bacterium]
MQRNIIDPSQLGELKDKVVTIKRVTKTVKGGRNMRFTALVVVGDGNGHVGAGLGKAVEIPEAIRKGKEDAMKHIVEIALDENGSVTHDYIGKYGSANVLLKKAPDGTGIIAGGPARVVCELAGIKNIRTKSLGSNNKQNVVMATIEGLSQVKSPEAVARNRGKSVEEIMA